MEIPREPMEHLRDPLRKSVLTPITLTQPPMATWRRLGRLLAMRVVPLMTPNNKHVASSSHDPNEPCAAAAPATGHETKVDLTAEIPDAPAEWPAKQSELQHSATLQHTTPTEPGPTPAKSDPNNDPVFESLDHELEHLRRVAERIQKQCEIEELRRLIAGKNTHACGKSLDALAEPPLPKRVVTEFATLPIQ